LAIKLEELRLKYKAAGVVVNSWLRPPSYNKRIGGAAKSVHLQGLAVDVLFAGCDNNKVFASLDKTWQGGLAIKKDWSGKVGFIHIDLGAKRRWEYPKG